TGIVAGPISRRVAGGLVTRLPVTHRCPRVTAHRTSRRGRSTLFRQKLPQTLISANTFPDCFKSLRHYMKRAIILLSIVLAGCSATVPATMRIERHQILRGSASGKVGRDAVISVKNPEGLSCTGKMFIPVTETTTEGTI